MFNIHTLIGAAIGFVVGAFCPSILRKIKSFFVKESTAVKTEAEKVAKKLPNIQV